MNNPGQVGPKSLLWDFLHHRLPDPGTASVIWEQEQKSRRAIVLGLRWSAEATRAAGTERWLHRALTSLQTGSWERRDRRQHPAAGDIRGLYNSSLMDTTCPHLGFKKRVKKSQNVSLPNDRDSFVREAPLSELYKRRHMTRLPVGLVLWEPPGGHGTKTRDRIVQPGDWEGPAGLEGSEGREKRPPEPRGSRPRRLDARGRWVSVPEGKRFLALGAGQPQTGFLQDGRSPPRARTQPVCPWGQCSPETGHSGWAPELPCPSEHATSRRQRPSLRSQIHVCRYTCKFIPWTPQRETGRFAVTTSLRTFHLGHSFRLTAS